METTNATHAGVFLRFGNFPRRRSESRRLLLHVDYKGDGGGGGVRTNFFFFMRKH